MHNWFTYARSAKAAKKQLLSWSSDLNHNDRAGTKKVVEQADAAEKEP